MLYGVRLCLCSFVDISLEYIKLSECLPYAQFQQMLTQTATTHSYYR